MRPDCLAGFLFNEETGAFLLIGGSGWGTVFLLLFLAAARLVSHGKWPFR